MVPGAALLSLVLLAVGCNGAARAPAGDHEGETDAIPEPAPPRGDRGGPVLVELYTSQGCSSCPPADSLLRDLVANSDGPRVIALAFHVDYWNDLGWRDVFSRGEWTRRQRRYARALAGGRVYTPMLVVDGAEHMVGSREKTIRRALAAAAGHDKRALHGTATLSGGVLSARVRLEAGDEASIYVAVVEGERSTQVERGENAGRSLAYTHIVRALQRADEVTEEGDAEVRIAFDSEWHEGGPSAVAFAQRKSDGRVIAATVLSLE